MRLRRLLCWALAAALLCALLPPAGAADFLIQDGVLTVYSGPGGTVTVPEEVTAIGPEVFAGREDIVEVALPGNLAAIEDRAFANCTGLVAVRVPGRVTRLGTAAFEGCVSLVQANVMGRVTELSEGLFRGCVRLTQLSLPPTVTRFGAESFFGCTAISALTVEANVTWVGDRAFANCTGLKTVDFLNPDTRLGADVFQNCAALERVLDRGEELGTPPYTLPEQPTPPEPVDPEPIGPEPVDPEPVNPAGPVGQSRPAAPEWFTAYSSTQSVEVDGQGVEFKMYALKDERGYDTNYIRVRDLAAVLAETPGRFHVTWQGERVNLYSHTDYVPLGSELDAPFSDDQPCLKPDTLTAVDGAGVKLDAILLKDSVGGGYTYYKLRDLGRYLGFNVDWSGDRGVYIETDRPYQGG